MSSDALKVALLAPAGTARDRLREVIGSADAQCVLEGDPAELDPARLAASEARVVLVALDPQVEDALEAFDDVLANPDLEVIYEEASLTASREGWDIARWQRHLVAKMQSHSDVLPPGTEQEEPEAATDVADAVDGIDVRPVALTDAEDNGGELDGDTASPVDTPSAPAAEPVNPFDPVFAESSDEPGISPPAFEPGDVADGLDLSIAIEAAALDDGAEVDHVDVASVADDPHADPEPDTDADADADAGAASESATSDDAGEPALPATGAFGSLSLDDGSAPAAVSDDSDAKNRFERDISDLQERISGLTLVDDSPRKEPEGARGAVLVLAGLGGPDAVRQLVAAIPEGFPRPILIQQRLDGGRHDRLVAQMQRATELPVRLAEPGHFAHAGIIYILPAELGVDVTEGGIRFGPEGEIVASLPAGDSAVLLLSGSDPSVVDATLKHGWAGALVAGQAGDGCYDAAASTELATRGGDTGTPIELAQRLVERWPA